MENLSSRFASKSDLVWNFREDTVGPCFMFLTYTELGAEAQRGEVTAQVSCWVGLRSCLTHSPCLPQPPAPAGPAFGASPRSPRTPSLSPVFPPAPRQKPCSRCTSSSMEVSLPVGVASFTLRQVKTRPMSRSVGLMSSWLMVVSLFPSFSSSWGGTSGRPGQATPPLQCDQDDPAQRRACAGGA